MACHPPDAPHGPLARLDPPLRAAAITSLVLLLSLAPLAHGTPPGEVTGDQFVTRTTLAWNAAAGADDYNVYRGSLSGLASGAPASCHGNEIAATTFEIPASPAAGDGYFYLVTAESTSQGEGTAGNKSSGSPRVLLGSCDRVVRNHVLNRAGYGWNEWSSARLASLGTQGYLAEQLDPGSIDESTNTELSTRTAPLVPPDTLQELQALDIVTAVYGRRQLEQQAAMFWVNHFDTSHTESFQFFGFYNACPTTRSLEAARFHYNPEVAFRDLGFNATFRDIVEASGLSPGMVVFLDTFTNVASAPNENYARELLELHTMGVDGDYTQQDIVELARVFTGWNVCKKSAPNAGDPLAACFQITPGTYCTGSEPVGVWTSNFRATQHDTGQKILFQGTPYQRIIPARSGTAGVQDVQDAFDAIAAHPSTSRFIARKLLQRFVTETPSQSMIDNVVAEWNDGGNPLGAGDLRAVLGSVLAQSEFLSPDSIGGKIKTPFEHIVSGFRAARGRTNGDQNLIRSGYLARMSELPHTNSVPTGFSELGGDWLDTNGLLERQNFGLQMTAAGPAATTFGNDIAGLLVAFDIPTTAGNAPAIVDFFADVLFGGALTLAERQEAIDYLNTDDNGNPSGYNTTRIRETMGFLMGYAQFLEQ
jgi:uncharacterized protein (DUF1800 family)